MSDPGAWARPMGAIHYDDGLTFEFYKPLPELLCWFFPSYWRYQFAYSDNLEMLFFMFKRQPLRVVKIVLIALWHSLRFKQRFCGGGFIAKQPPSEMAYSDDNGETFTVVELKNEPAN